MFVAVLNDNYLLIHVWFCVQCRLNERRAARRYAPQLPA